MKASKNWHEHKGQSLDMPATTVLETGQLVKVELWELAIGSMSCLSDDPPATLLRGLGRGLAPNGEAAAAGTEPCATSLMSSG